MYHVAHQLIYDLLGVAPRIQSNQPISYPVCMGGMQKPNLASKEIMIRTYMKDIVAKIIRAPLYGLAGHPSGLCIWIANP